MKTRQCPHCSASMDIETSVCPECGNPILSQSKKRRLPTWFFILIILEIIGIGVLIFYFTYGRFAKKDAYLNAMAIGLERRFSETRNTDEMTDEEILEWYRSVVDGELAYIEDYADRSFQIAVLHS